MAIPSIDPIDVLGIAGVVLILFGFYRTSVGEWSNHSLVHELDNLAGVTMLGIHEYVSGAYIPLILNIVYAIVAFKGITSFTERRKIHAQYKKDVQKAKR